MNKDNKRIEVDNTDKKLHISDVMCRFLPFFGGLITIFREQDYYIKNKIWFIPYHFITSIIVITYIISFIK
jgi:hypothetical protein